MKKALFYVLLASTINTGFSQTVDIGFKPDCFECYEDTIYNCLISIIDSVTLNKLAEDDVYFKVHVTWSMETGYTNEVMIIDKSDVLSDQIKEDYKSILFSHRFVYLCHSEHDVYDKMTRDVIKGENMGLLTGNFHVWWKRKTWQNNRKSNIQNSIKSD